MTATMTELFGEPIHTYTREQAIEDGVLVDCSQGWLGEMAREAGILWPVAMTRTAFDRFVTVTPAAKRAANDEKGRWWDVVWMFRCASKRGPGGDTLRFQLHCVVDESDTRRLQRGRMPGPYTLKAVCGPLGPTDPRPCITLMLPEED